MIVGHIGGAGSPYEIQKSLRFRASASAYLSRTPTVAGNRKTWTWSGWVKRGALGFANDIISAGVSGGPYNYVRLGFSADNCLEFMGYIDSPGIQWYLKTAQVFRDPSAHFHLQVHLDTTNAIAADRVKVFISGVRVTSFITGAYATTYPAQNAEGWLGSTSYPMNIGRLVNASNYFDGYLSEINFIDGQALDPSYFGQVSAETGAWIPKKYTGAYGTNGFYLPFTDGSTLGNLTADRSGNGNNWTANNLSLTSGSSYDWMDDTPTNNYAVLNPTNAGMASTIFNAGLSFAGVANTNQGYVRSTLGVSTGKHYFELTGSTYSGAAEIGISVNGEFSAGYRTDGTKDVDGVNSAYGASYTASDIIGVAFDATLKSITFYKNNVSQGSFSWAAIGEAFPAFFARGIASHNGYINFGQFPFAYSPPAGFKALCTKNLPLPSILNPKKHFDVVLATGANIKSTAEAVFPGNFLEWIKDRGNANNHQLIDSVRGTSAVLQSNTTGAETTYSAPSGSSVGWTWKAGGVPVTNNAGSISSQVSANTAAGFSIVTYAGTSANATVGHGLGVAPALIIFKNRIGTYNWPVYAKPMNDTLGYIFLNLTNGKAQASAYWNSLGPTSTVINLGGSADVNTSGNTHVAYCFAEIPGYSKIGSYTGNGSTDGPFVYCGFRPKFLMMKRVDRGGDDWWIYDTARDAFNVAANGLRPDLSAAEYSAAALDLTSNGFKLRAVAADQNGSGGSYIFMAFAEAPFQFANVR